MPLLGKVFVLTHGTSVTRQDLTQEGTLVNWCQIKHDLHQLYRIAKALK